METSRKAFSSFTLPFFSFALWCWCCFFPWKNKKQRIIHLKLIFADELNCLIAVWIAAHVRQLRYLTSVAGAHAQWCTAIYIEINRRVWCLSNLRSSTCVCFLLIWSDIIIHIVQQHSRLQCDAMPSYKLNTFFSDHVTCSLEWTKRVSSAGLSAFERTPTSKIKSQFCLPTQKILRP